MIRVILTVSVTLIAGLLWLLLLRYAKRQRKLIQHGVPAIGIVESVQKKRSGNNLYYAVTISFRGNEKTFRHVHNDHLYTRFQTGQQTEVRYLAEDPRFAYLPAQSDKRMQNTPKQLFLTCGVIIAFAYALILISVLMPEEDKRRTVMNIFLCSSMLVSTIVMYLDERALSRMQDQVTGTVAYAEKRKRGYFIVAEYTVGDHTYRTRDSRIPLMTPYIAGDPVIVRYHPQKPYRSMIADDRYALRYAKIMLLRCILEITFLSAFLIYEIFGR